MVDINENSMRINLHKKSDDSYDIVFAGFAQIPAGLKELNLDSRRVAIITDSNLIKVGLASELEEALQDSGKASQTFSFPAGEKYKTLRTAEKLVDELSAKKEHEVLTL